MNNYFRVEHLKNNTYQLSLFDIWNKETLPDIIENIKQSNISRTKNLIVDFENLKELDSISIIYLISFLKKINR